MRVAATNPSAVTVTTRRRPHIDPLIAALLIALGVLIMIIGVQKPGIFFLPANILNIGQAITMLGLIALAETVVIIMGGLDLSAGSIVGLVSILVALGMRDNNNLMVGIAVGLIAGAAAGLFNGLLITKGRIEPIIATLGTMAVYRGLAFTVTKGAPIGIMDKSFNKIGSGHVLGIPNPVIILVVVALGFYVLLNLTYMGRHIYAVGGNAIAAGLTGININGYKLGIYALSGLIAGVAAIILTARSNAGQPNAGVNFELDAITAAALGGTAMSGGKGSVLGTILGVLIIGVLNNGMVLLGVSQFYQFIARGALLIIAVLIQRWFTRN
jgi:ribose/xylose/arabinose/galactoside ABC-type transport system permease subunit